jgi:hypothetical protein
VTKLYNEEMHVIASKSIRNLRDLEGKTISVDLPNGGTFVTALTVFERLGLKPKVVYIEQRIALEKLKAGEIDAVIVVGGKPYKAVSGFNDDRFHLVTVDYEKALQADYLPASLSAKDYPNLISEQEQVDTIAVPAVLAAYNWGPDTERYRSSRCSWTRSSRNFPPSRIRPSTRNGRRFRYRRHFRTGDVFPPPSNGSTGTASSPSRAPGSTNS